MDTFRIPYRHENKSVRFVFKYSEVTRELLFFHKETGEVGIVKLSAEDHREYERRFVEYSYTIKEVLYIDKINFFKRILDKYVGTYPISIEETQKSYGDFDFKDFVTDLSYAIENNDVYAEFKPLDADSGDFEVLYYKERFYFSIYKEDEKYHISKNFVHDHIGKATVTNKGQKWVYSKWNGLFEDEEYSEVSSESEIFKSDSDLKNINTKNEDIRANRKSIIANELFFEKHFGSNVAEYLSHPKFRPGLFKSLEVMFKALLQKDIKPYINKQYFPKTWKDFYKDFGKGVNGYKKYAKTMSLLNDFYDKEIKKTPDDQNLKSLSTLQLEYELSLSDLDFSFIREDTKFFRRIERLCERKSLNKSTIYAIVDYLYPNHAKSRIYNFVNTYGEGFNDVELNESSTEEEVLNGFFKANSVVDFMTYKEEENE